MFYFTEIMMRKVRLMIAIGLMLSSSTAFALMAGNGGHAWFSQFFFIAGY